MQVYVADRVWDGVSDAPIGRGFVRVDGHVIDAVGRSAELPADTDVRDLGDVTLVPGLINGHVHITFCASTAVLNDYLAERDAGFDTLLARAKDNLQRSINVGCTTVRDLGTLNDVVFAARAGVRDGTITGSDIVCAGEGITSKGGHCHFFGIEAEGPDEVRAAVRRQKEAGADLIKIFATGGNLTPNTDPFSPQYSLDELHTAVEEARNAGLPIAAHAHATEGIRRSVAAGVDTIEHCLFETPDGIDFDETIAVEMAERGVTVVPTLGGAILQYLEDPSLIDQIPEPGHTVLSRLVPKFARFLANFQRMRELGVTVIAGSDSGIPQRPFDSFPQDLIAMAADAGIGMGARATMLASTSECARALGLTDRGMIEPGRRADLLAVDGNPLDRIDDIANTRFVTVAGRVAVDR